MDINRNKWLEKRYWEGLATIEEEEELRRSIAADGDGLSREIKVLFGTLEALAPAELDAEFDNEFWTKVEPSNNIRKLNVNQFMRYAAIGLICLAVGLALWNIALSPGSSDEMQAVAISGEDTYADPKAAFEETRRALMFASEKLNKGKAPISEIKRFYTTRMSISGIETPSNGSDTLKTEQ